MKFLMIGAHQDDAECFCGGLTALLKQKGHSVKFLSCCNGCGGHHKMNKEETVKRRAQESKKVAQVLDIEYDVWTDMDDCSITPSLENRRRMINYIREYNPDVVITHRTNDYHADHRAVGMLVQDASYILIVPNECPETKAMRKMPVILFFEDAFTQPPFIPHLIVPIDSVIDTKLKITSLNESQIYEWLPYTKGQPEVDMNNPEEVFNILYGMKIDENTTDEEIILKNKDGYAVEFATTAARFRKELIKKYGKKGKKIRYAEAFSCSEYGEPLTEEIKKLFE